jgi:hypothetical protein
MSGIFRMALAAATVATATVTLVGVARAENVSIRVVSPISPPSINNLYLHVAYDALVGLNAFGVDRGMTPGNIATAMNMAVENKALERPVPPDPWVDFRFQEEALRRLGKFKP